ncbi:hypothetical protein BKA81DRAFT_54599 [Phyllosticta paracitricarpa]|uniref:F-box domain-containing protein n=2 Tax=Phyllosticta TaxID=121621 RepID=A0ABR1MKR6_9PEZI
MVQNKAFQSTAMDGVNRLNRLPTEMYQLVASFLPVKDFKTLRQVDHNAAHQLEYELKLRVGPFKTIKETSREGLENFLEINEGPYMDRITTLLIKEDEIMYNVNRVILPSFFYHHAEAEICIALFNILNKLPNLKAIVWQLGRSRDFDQSAFSKDPTLPFMILLGSLQRRTVKIHLAADRWDFVVYWRGSLISTDKIRIIGGGPSDSTQHSQLRLFNDGMKLNFGICLDDVLRYVCQQPNATHLSNFSFQGYNQTIADEWHVLRFDAFIDRVQTLVIENCILSDMMPWAAIVGQKVKLSITKSKVDADVLRSILDAASDPQQTPNLQYLWLEELDGVYFNWSDGTTDSGAHLQQVIAEKGLRRAADYMLRALREWQPSTMFGDTNRNKQPLSRVWDRDPRHRRLMYQRQDQHFQAHYRR